MKNDHIIGSDEWKLRILDDLKNVKNYLMNMSKDMSAYKVDCIITELTTYFKQDERKN